MVGQLIMDWSYTDVVKLEANTFNSTEIMVETSTMSQVLLGIYDRSSPPQYPLSLLGPGCQSPRSGGGGRGGGRSGTSQKDFKQE